MQKSLFDIIFLFSYNLSVRKHIERIFGLATSGTARDTYVLFGGNVFAAFLGFLFTIVIARALTVSDFGVFSAAANLIAILMSLSDLGLSSGIVNFVSYHISRGETKTAEEYEKAAFIVKIVASSLLSLLVVIFAVFISKHWLATADKQIAYWVAVVSFTGLFWRFLPYMLQAKKQFLKSVLIDIFVSFPKALIPLVFVSLGILTVKTTLLAFEISVLIAGSVGLIFTGINFMFAHTKKETYLNLTRFSSWLGFNRITSSIAGNLDVQMLAALAGAVATGLYSIPAKLTAFLVILASSFSAVLAPRMAGFADKSKEKTYIIKATLVTLGIVFLILCWIIVAKPFILILFGQKYLPSVPIFQALSASMIPFILTVPSVTAIIYGMKKTVFIGLFSFFQLAAIFSLNYIFIPKYGPFGPTLTYAITNTILAIYTWWIVIKYYWIDK